MGQKLCLKAKGAPVGGKKSTLGSSWWRPGSFFGVISPPFAATAGSLHLDLALAAFIPHPTLHLPHHTPIYPDLRQGPNPACSVSYQLDSRCQGQVQWILLTHLSRNRSLEQFWKLTRTELMKHFERQPLTQTLIVCKLSAAPTVWRSCSCMILFFRVTGVSILTEMKKMLNSFGITARILISQSIPLMSVGESAS